MNLTEDATKELEECCFEELSERSKNRRILLISTDEHMGGFARKLKDKSTPTEETWIGNQREIAEKVRLHDKTTTVLLQHGLYRSIRENDEINRVRQAAKTVEKIPDNACRAKVVVDKKGWKLKLEPGTACERTISDFDKFPRHVRKYLMDHIEK